MQTTHTRQRGLSLVELMVALLIGVILTSGVISVYITSKTSYSMNMGLGQVQEAGRFALQTLQPILTMGGNMGCRHPTPTEAATFFSNVTSTDDIYNLKYAVYGYDYTGTGNGAYLSDSTGSTSNSPTVDNSASHWTPNLSAKVAAALNGIAVKYSDVLIVHELLSNPASITATGTTSTNIVYQATNAPAMVAGQLLLASNCNRQWSEFTAGTVGTNTIAVPGTGSSGVIQDYSNRPAGSVGPVQTYVFFVGKGLDGGPSLYETYLGTNAQLVTPVEIVPGVENMQVLYGEDLTVSLPPGGGDETLSPDYYKTADNVTNWARVVSVRVALVVHSDPNSVDKAPSTTTAIHMLGTGFTDSFSYKPYADRRMRRYFAQTFSLRNSLP